MAKEGRKIAGDYPPESVRLTDAEIGDWIDRISTSTAFYDRDDSTKGNTNPKSHSTVLTGSASQRFSGNLTSAKPKPKPKPKAPIIGLPHKLENSSGYLGRSTRRGTSGRLFPKRKGVRVRVLDPGSPKVSCFGRIRSGKERILEKKKSWIRSLFGFTSCVKAPERTAGEGAAVPARKKKAATAAAAAVAKAEVVPVGLGGLRRFSSGRRVESWVEDDDDVERSGPLGYRRSLGSIDDLDCARKLDDVGPASV